MNKYSLQLKHIAEDYKNSISVIIGSLVMNDLKEMINKGTDKGHKLLHKHVL